MCTVSWVHEGGGYHLLCNRDEKRARAAALGPRFERRGGVIFLAPTDGAAGGTWLAVNQFGLAVCLLNGAARTAGTRSRGLVVRELAWAESADECSLWLRQLDLSPYAAFTLLMLEPKAPAVVAQWNGDTVRLDRDAEGLMPLTSSSYDGDAVCAHRTGEFERRRASAGRVDSGLLYWFHASHGRQADAYSPCMHRADAQTVSFSWVTVTAREVRFFYSPDAPCTWSEGEQQTLARVA